LVSVLNRRLPLTLGVRYVEHEVCPRTRGGGNGPSRIGKPACAEKRKDTVVRRENQAKRTSLGSGR